MLPKSPRKNGRALIVEGGGMRGSFAGGVLAAMSHCYPVHNFDLVVGVSAGSCAAAYYVTEDPGDLYSALRTLRIWRFELSGSRLINYFNGLIGRHFLNQDYLVDYLFGLKYRLRREKLEDPKGVPFYVVLSNLHTLVPEYVRATKDNVLRLLKAATLLPIATKGSTIFGNSEVTDGGVLDPIPMEAVLDAGYKDITVILNRPVALRDRPLGRFTARMAFPGLRRVGDYLRREHHKLYNRAKDLIENPPEGTVVRTIAPEQSPLGLVSTSEKKLNRAVEMGIEAAYRAFSGIRSRPHRSWFSRFLDTFR